MNKKVSVLIPCFNREKYIAISIKSVLEQTYKNFEIIIYDDGSVDKSVAIIKKLQAKYKCIRLITSNVNRGVSYARNVLLKSCTTQYACWLDSDDLMDRLRIKVQLELMSKDKLIFSNWCWLHENKRGDWRPTQRNTHRTAFATLMFPVNKKILFKEEIKLGGEDWEWIKRMRNEYKTEVIVKDRLYLVRYHEDRIGAWKKKIRPKVPKELLLKLSYKDLIDYYKKHYE